MLLSTTLKVIQAFSRLCDRTWLKLVHCKMIKCRPSLCGVRYCRRQGGIPNRLGEHGRRRQGYRVKVTRQCSTATPVGKMRKSLIQPQTFCFLLWIICTSVSALPGHSQRTILTLIYRMVVFPQLFLVQTNVRNHFFSNKNESSVTGLLS